MGRAPCCDKVGLKKGPWTPEEDAKLIQYIQANGPGNWRNLPKNAGLQRCGKSCRLRWTNYLRPDIKRGRFTFEEEETIIQLHSVLGNKWSAIAARLPGRTDNEIKNYWNTHIRKRLLRNGIDPITHRRRLDLLDLSSLLSSSLHNTGPINLSSLLSSQTLVNPQLLSLVNTLTSLKQENPALYLEILQENQQVSISQACDVSCNPDFFNDQPQLTQMTDMANYSFPNSQDMSCPSLAGNFVAQQNYVQCSSDNAILGHSEHMNLQPQMNNSNQNLNQNSFISTPSSNSTPLNSSSTFINGSTEDERESYCSSFLKFEIPEGLDFSELL